MKALFIFTHIIFTINFAFADMKYFPIHFSLRTENENYYEGEKIKFIITIINTDKNNTYPVLVPHTQNTGQKLFYLNIYDKANNTTLIRYTEDKMLNMMVHDTGSVQIKYLKPLEKIEIPIYLNDFENYFSYQTQNTSHHSFGIPIFAGIYKVNVKYNPNGIVLGDSIYNYYHDTDTELPNNGKLAMSCDGDMSNFCLLKIKRSADTLVSIERQKYFIKTDGYLYFYFNEQVDKITTDVRCIHITNLPSDSCSLPKGEYFYSQFTDFFNEYIVRFDDGDIREYRKFTNYCPDYLYTERYNELKQRTQYALQLPDKRFYSVSYNQPGGNINQETYCSEDGTMCIVSTYFYNKKGEFIRKKITNTEPCSVTIIDGKKRSATRVDNLESH